MSKEASSPTATTNETEDVEAASALVSSLSTELAEHLLRAALGRYPDNHVRAIAVTISTASAAAIKVAIAAGGQALTREQFMQYIEASWDRLAAGAKARPPSGFWTKGGAA
jgi:hypothetical protein